jgi:hypothetical protein
LLNKKMLIVAAVLIAVVAGVFAMRGRDSGAPVAPREEALGAEAALPKFAADESHVLLKVENVEGLRKALDMLKGFMPLMKDPDVMDMMRDRYDVMKELDGTNPVDSVEKFDAAMKYIAFSDAFLAAADEIAFLGASPDVCMTFFTDEEKFAAMKEALGREGGSSEAWDTSLAGEGGEAWIVRDTIAALNEESGDIDVTMYVLKRADGKRTQVITANSEETARRAVRAWESPSDRAVIERNLDAPNFIQYRIENSVIDGEPRSTANEIAWAGDGRTTKIDAFSDFSDSGSTPVTSGVESAPVPMYGTGEPVLLMTVDLAYILSIVMPGVENPAERLVSLIEKYGEEQIPLQFRNDVIAVLAGSRVSLGVFMKPDRLAPSTAYIAFELKDTEALNKYFSLAGIILKPAQIEGWEHALTEQNIFDNDAYEGLDTDVTLARNGNLFILGLGAPDEYAVRAPMPEAMSGMPETGVILSSYISTKFIVDESTALGAAVREAMEDRGDGRELSEFIDRLGLDKFESISSVQADIARSESRIVWNQPKQ